MTWNWSHSQEGIDNVRTNISNMNPEDLKVCLCNNLTYKKVLFLENIDRLLDGEEPITYPTSPSNYFDETIYNEFYQLKKVNDLVNSHKKSSEEYTDLSEIIFNLAKELSECDNGVFNAYLDPYHEYAVSFSLVKEKDCIRGIDVHSIDTSR
jgi:hypothetical protein